MVAEQENLRASCQAVLRDNDAGGYTVPTRGLYPFQWLWDSGFSAIGWQTFDEPRAWQELETLLKSQWPSGMIPHIVHHRTDTGYSLDHTWWRAPGPVPSSGITQPPNLATAVRLMCERARDSAVADMHARALTPRILAFHHWLHTQRDPHGTGLVTLLHPWEGGMDDSPVWDIPLASVPRMALDRPRPDTQHVDPKERPTPDTYERYMYLVNFLRERDYDPERCVDTSPFAVAGVGFNAILGRANRDLLYLLERFGLEGAEQVKRWIEHGDRAMAARYDASAAAFWSLDVRSQQSIPVRTFEAFMPLFGRQATQTQADALAHVLRDMAEHVTYLIPSTHPLEAAFEPRRYWRGPVWVPVNWLLADGFRAYGHDDVAKRLLSDARALVQRSGLREYYHPITGEGLGGGAFSWTAALLLDAERYA